MQYWLMKSEPNVFGIKHLQNMPGQRDHWDGIRNYQARNYMRDQMALNDQVFFYHSNCAQPGIVGIMTVVSTAYPDHTAWDPQSHYYDPKSSPQNPRWIMVDVQFSSLLTRVVSLQEMKARPELADMRLVQRGNRLSILPVTPEQWAFILTLSQQ